MKPTIEDVVLDRHPSTQHFAHLFQFKHLPPHLQGISELCHDLAVEMIINIPDGSELSAGLRKLREAKDCFVTAAVIDHEEQQG